jgi:hypothetical protein
MTRPSTSLPPEKRKQDVDHRDEPGDDSFIVDAFSIASRSLSSGALRATRLARNDDTGEQQKLVPLAGIPLCP